MKDLVSKVMMDALNGSSLAKYKISKENILEDIEKICGKHISLEADQMESKECEA